MATADAGSLKSTMGASPDWRKVSPYLFILPAVLVMIAGLLNVLAIFDAAAGPVLPPADDEKDKKSSPENDDTDGEPPATDEEKEKQQPKQTYSISD